jgi:hypothetical protein
VLRNDRTPAEVKLAVWEPVPADAKAVLRVIVNRGQPKDHGVRLRDGKEAEFRDELFVSFNGRSLARTTVDPGWAVAIAVRRNGPFPPLSYLAAEKLELHLGQPER